MQSDSFIDYDALEKAPLMQNPFPYCIIPNFLIINTLTDLIRDFPMIVNRGSIPSGSLSPGSLFQRFCAELEGSLLREKIAKKFALNLEHKPTMLTLRGNTTARDGAIHTDSKSKLITLLLYMNPTWNTDHGKLRSLRNKYSLDDYVAEISPLAGSCLIFKVTPHGWHGHTPYVGKRLSLQLNYLTNEAALNKHLNHHRLTAWLKRWLPKVFHRNLEHY